MSDREPESVAFERVPLGGGRGGRRFDPMLLGVVAVVIGLGAAIVKPWDAVGDGGAGAASASHAAGSPAAGAATSPASGPPPAGESILTAAPIAWPRAAAAIRPHDEWGVRVIVRDPEPPAADDPAGGFVERWSGIDNVANPMVADRAVVAMGLTFPRDTTPLDIHLWRLVPAGGWRWLDVQALDRTSSGGAYLFTPPVIDGVQLPTWPSGAYRADVLVGGGVLRTDIVLGGSFQTIPDGRTDGSDGALGSTFGADLSGLQGGAFATVDGVAMPLSSKPGPPLDAAEAWLDVVHDDGTDQSGPVGVGYLPRANGLGVLLDPGASALTATIRRLAPDDGPTLETTRAVGLRFGTDGDRAAYVVFRAPGGVAFAPGVYAIDAAWTTAEGRQEATYNVELRPGPERLAPELLEAARVYAPQTGVDALVIAGPDYGAGYGSLISVLPLVPGSGDGTYRDIGCDSSAPIPLTGRPRVIGLAHAVETAPQEVGARLLFEGGRELDVPLLLSPNAAPGMSLLAPADGPDFVPGVYRMTLRAEGVTRSVTVCLGAFATTR
jgi:hypothetical protein